MAKAAAVPNDAIRAVLESTEMTRDALPYTDEFERLYSGHKQTTGEKLTKHQFWKKISNAAKRGGWKGKNRGEPAPSLTLQQLDVLRSLAAGKLGARDNLAYTKELDEILRRFNKATGPPIVLLEPWLLRLCGRSRPTKSTLARLRTTSKHLAPGPSESLTCQ